jgi:predicted metal-binding protein
MLASKEMEKFDFLKEKALNMGAVDTRLITVDNIYVENRVTLKCKVGCIGYGKKLTCPPYVPTVNEFREILGEYRYALLIKFKSPAETDYETTCSIYKNWLDPDTPEDLKEKADEFWAECFDYGREILDIMLELEKTAFNAGYTFALAFVNGSCRLCEVCNTASGICIHPSKARISEHAVGVNMEKTANEAGIKLKFPFSGNPEHVTILLIE